MAGAFIAVDGDSLTEFRPRHYSARYDDLRGNGRSARERAVKSAALSFAPLLAWDADVFRFLNSHHHHLGDAFFLTCSTLGSAWVIVPVFLLFLVMFAGRQRLLTVLIASAATLVAGAVLVEVIKNGVDRPRPPAYFETVGGQRGGEGEGAGAVEKIAGRESFTVHNVGPALRERSFPSGHSWVSFEIAALLAFFFGKKFKWAFLAAAAIAFSRVYVGVHFPLDVMGGACGGTLLAFIAWRVTVWIAPDRARP